MGWAEVWGGGGEEGEEGAAESVGGVEQPSPCCPAANTLPGDQRQVLTCTILSGRRIHLKLLRILLKRLALFYLVAEGKENTNQG